MNQIRKIVENVERKYQQQVNDLIANGVTPRPQGVATIVGCEPFMVSIRPIAKGRAGIDISCGRHGDSAAQIIGDHAPGPDFDVDAGALLKGLVAAWPVLSRPFRQGSPVYESGPKVEADWAALSGISGMPTLKFIAEGPGLRLEYNGGSFDPGSECLIVAECLMTVGDLLAQWSLDAEAIFAWHSVRGLADIMAFSPMVPPHFETANNPNEDAFYARKLGTDLEKWRGHMLARSIDLRHAWKPFPDDLTSEPPDREMTAARIVELAAHCKIDLDELTDMLIHESIIESRHQCFYAKWPAPTEGFST